MNVASVYSSRAEKNRLIQISYSATATILGDKTLYPTFYRVIPDDYHQIKVGIYFFSRF